jgi:DNA-binding IclR family transcriptional regulator
MGVETTSRTPAVHRALAILDAVALKQATTPAALAGRLGLPKSSIADLTTALEEERLLGKDSQGQFMLGLRTAGILGDNALIARAARKLVQTPLLDGHTVSVVKAVGLMGICVEVRMGQHPLPLTPRAGLSTPILDSGGGLAILRSLPVAAARDATVAYAGHQGFSGEQLEEVLAQVAAAKNHPATGAVLLTDSLGVLQMASPVRHSNLAVVVHLPPARRVSDAELGQLAAGLSEVAAAAEEPPG